MRPSTSTTSFRFGFNGIAPGPFAGVVEDVVRVGQRGFVDTFGDEFLLALQYRLQHLVADGVGALAHDGVEEAPAVEFRPRVEPAFLVEFVALGMHPAECAVRFKTDSGLALSRAVVELFELPVTGVTTAAATSSVKPNTHRV